MAKAWEREYPRDRFNEEHYNLLVRRAGALSSGDFILLGGWKDRAGTDKQWRFNVASVAYPAWIDASRELPDIRVEQLSVERFLREWADHRYPDTSSRSGDGKKRFGLSRATTLLHFMSAGAFPIYDSRVRRAVKRLCNEGAPDNVDWYRKSYIPIFHDLLTACSASARHLDKALFGYGYRP